LSGSAVLRYTGFVKFYGEEKGRDYMKKLSAQKAAFRDSETVVTSELTEGGKLYAADPRWGDKLGSDFLQIMARVAVYPGK
jgi:hypothetical protein